MTGTADLVAPPASASRAAARSGPAWPLLFAVIAVPAGLGLLAATLLNLHYLASLPAPSPTTLDTVPQDLPRHIAYWPIIYTGLLLGVLGALATWIAAAPAAAASTAGAVRGLGPCRWRTAAAILTVGDCLLLAAFAARPPLVADPWSASGLTPVLLLAAATVNTFLIGFALIEAYRPRRPDLTRTELTP